MVLYMEMIFEVNIGWMHVVPHANRLTLEQGYPRWKILFVWIVNTNWAITFLNDHELISDYNQGHFAECSFYTCLYFEQIYFIIITH